MTLPFSDHEASMDAAAAAAPMARVTRERVFNFVESLECHGATDEEISVSLGVDGNTVRPRRGELVTAGRLAFSGRYRQTRSRRRAKVWVAPKYVPGAQQDLLR